MLSVKARDVTLEDCGGAFVMVSESSRSTETEGLKGAIIINPLNNFHQRAVEIAAEYEQPVIGDRGQLLRRRLSGASLSKAIASRLKAEGYGHHNWQDIPKLLDDSEDILRARAWQHKYSLVPY